LFTTTDYYESPLYNGGLSFVQKGDISLRLPVAQDAVVTVSPLDATQFYFSAQLLTHVRIYGFQPPNPATFVNVPFSGVATGIAIDNTGAEYLTGPGASGVKKFSSPTSGTALFEFGTSGAGTLSTPTALAIGPDGLLYVLDTGNSRVVSFDTDGDYVSAFSLLPGFSTDTMAIGTNGWLYTADGNGGGEIYDIYTGNVVGNFSSVGSNPVSGGSRTALVAEGNYLYLLDQNTGLHVFGTAPVPATWTLVLAAGIAGVALRRRVNRHIVG
jgi:hypothetical protein